MEWAIREPWQDLTPQISESRDGFRDGPARIGFGTEKPGEADGETSFYLRGHLQFAAGS